MTAADYAQAIYRAGSKASSARVREALARRGHSKLLPQIYREYQKIVLQKKRHEAHARSTPARERTRVLLELYRKLVSSQ